MNEARLHRLDSKRLTGPLLFLASSCGHTAVEHGVGLCRVAEERNIIQKDRLEGCSSALQDFVERLVSCFWL